MPRSQPWALGQPGAQATRRNFASWVTWNGTVRPCASSVRFPRSCVTRDKGGDCQLRQYCRQPASGEGAAYLSDSASSLASLNAATRGNIEDGRAALRPHAPCGGDAENTGTQSW